MKDRTLTSLVQELRTTTPVNRKFRRKQAKLLRMIEKRLPDGLSLTDILRRDQ